MKVLIVSIIILMFCVGCAHAVPVTFVWINPLFNQVPNSCASSVDTCLDIATIKLFVQEQGRSDSTLAATRNVVGKFGKADSVTVDLKTDRVWFAWAQTWDLSGLISCNSNLVLKDLRVPPSSAMLKP